MSCLEQADNLLHLLQLQITGPEERGRWSNCSASALPVSGKCKSCFHQHSLLPRNNAIIMCKMQKKTVEALKKKKITSDLRRWLGSRRETLEHTLSCCSKALNEGKYCLWHDQFLNIPRTRSLYFSFKLCAVSVVAICICI